MRVAIITRYPWGIFWGGAEVQAQHYVNYFSSRPNCNVEFIESYERSKRYDAYHFVGLGYSTAAMASKVKSYGAKVILSPVFYLSEKDEWLLRLRRHLKIAEGPVGRLYGDALAVADLILPNSRAESDQLIRIWRGEPSKISVLPNGYDGTQFNEEIEIGERPIKAKYILCVSMIDERKNILELMEAFLSRESSTLLVLCGEVRSASLKFAERFRELIIKANGRICHLGLVNDPTRLAALYRHAEAHILPSTLETPGIANLEAAAMGTPVVMGDCAPVREYFEKNGNFIKGKSHAAITHALCLIEAGAVIRPNKQDMSVYSWDAIGTRLHQLYEAI